MFQSLKNWWAGVRGKLTTAIKDEKEAKLVAAEKTVVEESAPVVVVPEPVVRTKPTPVKKPKVAAPVKNTKPAAKPATPVKKAPVKSSQKPKTKTKK